MQKRESGIDLLRCIGLLDVWVYALFLQWHTPEQYPLLFVCVTIPIYILSILAGRGVHWLSGWCLSRLKRLKKEGSYAN